jgi:hypothetical protein
MDEVPLPLRPALKSPYPTDEEVIRRIHEAVAKRPDWLNVAHDIIEQNGMHATA